VGLRASLPLVPSLLGESGSPVSQHRRKTTADLRNASYGTADYAIEELEDVDLDFKL
jgi:hypothetical protein